MPAYLDIALVNVAALIGVAAVALKDQVALRATLILSTVLYITYFFVVPEAPLWNAIFWSTVNLAVNGVVMVRLICDRTHFRMSDDELRLFAAFRVLSPGEFRTLTGIATWRTATAQTLLTREGAPVERLYYVIDGAIGIAKSGRSFPIAAGTFIGEIAFLRGQHASATVTLEEGARYIEWSTKRLADLLERNPSLKTSLDVLFNADMAQKVARA
jgi:hypothetical protein